MITISALVIKTLETNVFRLVWPTCSIPIYVLIRNTKLLKGMVTNLQYH